MPEKELAKRVYAKLLRLYPREFRERFGREMEQIFNDLSREREVVHRSKWLRIAWLFGDLFLQAGRENISSMRRRNIVESFSRNARLASLVGIVTMLPGALMLLLLFLGIEPPLGPLGELLRTPPDGTPTILGISSVVVLVLVVFLPLAGVVVVSAIKNEGRAMADLGIAAVVGLIVVSPMMLLQLTVGRVSYSYFPSVLFGLIWMLSALFAAVAASTVRSVRGGDNVLANPTLLFTKIAFLMMIAVFWAGIVFDQVPCFLGVPNCD